MQNKRVQPAPGQESVWDYPRPPRLEPSKRRVRVKFAGQTIAESTRAFRVLETSHPPTWYLPREDVRDEFLVRESKRSLCEWKGEATYWSVTVGPEKVEHAAWSYERPAPPFQSIAGHLAFYPGSFECYLDEERVQGQPGDFYGGWITADVVGPFKGGAGSWGW